MNFSFYHVIVYVPVADADRIRHVLADAGAGHIGAYDSCSFSAHGVGRFRPLKGSKPSVGTEGKIEEVEEERIEVLVPGDRLTEIVAAVRKAHPYEEPAIHALPVILPE